MVVLAASVVTKTGKALVSRQYMDMSRIRIEGLLAAFPKLVGTGKQHTYVETENVRYVYQPMEGLYLLLITNKASNILEDLETLRLLSKVVPEFVGSLDEEDVCRAAFDLIFAFDEVISLGFKESITIQQVKQNCEMESHEEKLHKMIIQSKINDTKDMMKKKAMEIDKQKFESRKHLDKSGLGSVLPGYLQNAASSLRTGLDMDTDSPSYGRPEAPSYSTPSSKAPSSRGPAKGMQLGKAKKANDFLETLAKEGDYVEVERPTPGKPAAAAAAVSAAEPVVLTIEEKLSVTLNREGGLDNFEVQGIVLLVVNQEEGTRARVVLNTGSNDGFQFKTHPNIDKALFSSSNILALKDPSRPFPIGSELGVLKWRFQSKEESLVPLTVSCWPSPSGAETYVNLEYESTAKFDLRNVVITIPLPHVGHAPTVNQIDGEWKYDSRKQALIWSILLLDDTNRNGSLEFVVPSTDTEAFYPIDVSFTTSSTYCQLTVESVDDLQSEAPVKYSVQQQLEATGYQVL